MVAVGVRPGLAFLEVRARYTVSVPRLALPSGATGRVGFVGLELVATRELHAGGQSLEAFAGPFGVLVHGAGSVGYGFGLVLGARWLFATSLPESPSFGLFMAAREVFWRLPPEMPDLNAAEAQIDLGLVATVF